MQPSQHPGLTVGKLFLKMFDLKSGLPFYICTYYDYYMSL